MENLLGPWFAEMGIGGKILIGILVVYGIGIILGALAEALRNMANQGARTLWSLTNLVVAFRSL
jgi:Ca2+/H+ antiporter